MKIKSLLAALFIVGNLTAQDLKLPSSSSKQIITQSLGTSTLKVNYSRPNTKGRTIFGDLVPYGEIWRTGADKLTDMTVEKEVSVAGNILKPGRYSIISIPDPKEWTIIINTEPDLWGAADHKPEKDVFRFKVVPKKLKEKQKTLFIGFENVTAFTMDFQLKWDKTLIEFPISINQDAEIEAAIEKAIAEGKKPYVSASIFYLNNGKDLNKALIWMQKAEEETKDKPYIYYWKAAVEHGLGMKNEALTSVNKSLALANKEGNKDYIRMSKALIKKLK